MRKYLRSFLLSLSIMIQYKSDIFMWFIVGCLNTGAMLTVWLNVLGKKKALGGFTQSDFIVYYLFFTIGWYVVAGFYATDMAQDIKNGVINTTLLKPYNKVIERFLREQAWKVVSLAVLTPVVAIAIWVIHEHLHLEITVSRLLLFITAIFFAGTIFAIFQAILGCIAFWIDEIWPIMELYWMASPVFGGSLAPLQFMPQPIQLIATFLPFKYVFSIPILILLNKSTTPLYDIAMQIFYCVILYIALQLLWRQGIKRYEAYGG